MEPRSKAKKGAAILARVLVSSLCFQTTSLSEHVSPDALLICLLVFPSIGGWLGSVALGPSVDGRPLWPWVRRWMAGLCGPGSESAPPSAPHAEAAPRRGRRSCTSLIGGF